MKMSMFFFSYNKTPWEKQNGWILRHHQQSFFSPVRTSMWELSRRIQQSGNTAWGVASGNTHKDNDDGNNNNNNNRNKRKGSTWTSLFFCGASNVFSDVISISSPRRVSSHRYNAKFDGNCCIFYKFSIICELFIYVSVKYTFHAYSLEAKWHMWFAEDGVNVSCGKT